MSSTGLFRCFKTSAQGICVVVMLCAGFPLSPRDVEQLLHERGMDIAHETARLWANRFRAIPWQRYGAAGSRRCDPSSIGDGISVRGS